MSFCGPSVNSTSYGARKLTECAADGIYFAPTLFFMLVSGIIMLVYWLKVRKQNINKHVWVRYIGHHPRWILTITLLTIQICALIEGTLSDMMYQGVHLHLYIPYAIAIIANIVTLCFYTFAENYNKPKFLALLLVYWALALVARILKLVTLHEAGLGPGHLRIYLVWIELILHIGLLLVDLIVLFKQRYLLTNSIDVLPPDELYNINYVHPYTNFMSKMTWQWMSPLLMYGYKNPLQMDDLGNIPITEHCVRNGEKLQRVFDRERRKAEAKGKEPSLWKCYFLAFWPMICLGGLYKLLADQLVFVGPFCLDGIVTYVINYKERQKMNVTLPMEPQYISAYDYFRNGYVLAFIAFIAYVLHATLMQNHLYLSVRQGVRIKGAIQAMVYSKSLRLSSYTMTQGIMSAGSIMNHMAVDPIHLLMLFYLGHWGWTLPIQLVMTFVFLYIQLGYAALISSVIVILLLPLQYYVGSKIAHLQKDVMKHADIRLKKSNEILQSIKLLKLYAWETIFRDSVRRTRGIEMRYLLKIAVVRVISFIATDSAPMAVGLVTFTIYPFIQDQPLTPGKVFSGLALFMILTLPLLLVTMVMNIIAHARVSTDRLLRYFLAPEIVRPEDRKLEAPVAEVPDVEFKKIDSEPIEMKDIKVLEKRNGPRLATPEFLTPEQERKQPLLGSEDDDQNSSEKEETTYKTAIENQKEADGSPDKKDDSSSSSSSSSDDDEPATGEEEASLVIEEVKSAVEIRNGNFSWDLEGRNVTLSDVNIKIPQGKLTIVVGQVGSGKSSLLAALLNEMTTISGEVAWDSASTVAYGAQKAWLMNATLKDNILFADRPDDDRYETVLETSALKPDLEILPAGDQTEIGEKGINLSGGQKQRVSIARTLYSSANVVILDDPLSAVDVHVGGHIFNKAISKFLLKSGRTVILVTHQLQYLPWAHQILMMKDGKVAAQGTLKQIKKSDPELYQAWKNAVQQASASGIAGTVQSAGENGDDSKQVTSTPMHRDLEQPHIEATPVASVPLRGYLSFSSLAGSMASLYSEDEATMVPQKQGDQDEKATGINEGEAGKLIEDEERETGRVKMKVYLAYIKAAATWAAILTIVMYVGRQSFRMATDYWLADWSEVSQEAYHKKEVERMEAAARNNGTTPPDDGDFGYDLNYYMTVFAILCTITIVFGLAAVGFLEYTCWTAARALHNKMLVNIVYAPMRFFDTTPLGRVINRLAGDTNTIDEKMPVTLDALIFCLLFVLGGVIVNAISTPFFLIPAVPMFIIYFAIQRFYITSCRELQRLDSVTKSPVLSHFSETLGGLTTIRAYRDQGRFSDKNLKNVDGNNTAFLYLHTANVWMGIRLDYLGAFIVFTAAISSLSSSLYGSATPGLVGISVAYALMVCTFLNHMMRSMSEGEMWFNAVERVSHYTNIVQEPYHKDKELMPSADWPSKGDIRFSNVFLRYDKSLDPVVRGLSFHITGGEKVGICGRTGSGKSSTTLGLFRIIDICEGSIIIDDIDISLVPLQALRSRLSIIPQDPVLFEGSVRYNLDPENQKDDQEVWQALEIAQLQDVISRMPEGLQAEVTEGGENFSVGQRQLFCLARAFLRNSRILIMDEATASIDMETDQVIQEVIKSAFHDRTVLTIAHRVATILNSDTILVLKDGEIVEHDTPQSLLQQEDSIFASMVRNNQ